MERRERPMTAARSSRRRWLAGCASLAAAGSALSPCWALAATQPVQRRLVVVMLRGAIDGLSVVAPFADPLYYALRPDIALPRPGEAGGLIDLDGRFGLHPSLVAIEPLWRQGALGFVHACGSPDPTRSHFDAQEYMETGTPGRKDTASGWLNRLAGLLPGEPSRMRLINVGPVTPRILAGPLGFATLPAGAGNDALADRPPVAEALRALYADDPSISRSLAEGGQARREMRASLQGMDAMADNGAMPVRGFAREASRLGTLMRRDPNAQLGFVSVGGWDTHVNQGAAQGNLATRLRLLGEGLAGLVQALGERRRDTLVLVMSEFGRTVRQNGNRGTDHGHGSVLWLLGGAAAGGRVHGSWQGLDDGRLHEGRDLPVTTDFRQVIGELAVSHLGLPAAQLPRLFPDGPALAAGSITGSTLIRG